VTDVRYCLGFLFSSDYRRVLLLVKARTCELGQVPVVASVRELPADVIPNLRWIVPLLADRAVANAQVREVVTG